MVDRSTRIAAVHLHALPVESVFHEQPGQQDESGPANGPANDANAVRRCAVRSDIRGRAVIVDVSRAARSAGIRPGMTVTEARARDPELEVRDRDADAELRRLENAAELLLAFGSTVEVAPPSFAFVEIGRSGPALEKLLGAPATETRIAARIVEVMNAAGHVVSVAIAKDPDTARTLAAQITEQYRAQLAPIVEKGRSLRVKGRRAQAKDARKPEAAAPDHTRATSRDSAYQNAARVTAEKSEHGVQSWAAPRPRARSRGAGKEPELDPKSRDARETRAPDSNASPTERPRGRYERTNLRTAKPVAPPLPHPRDREPPLPAPISIVPTDRETAALNRLPLEALLWTDAQSDPDGTTREDLLAAQSALRILGIHDVARLRTLSPAQVASRFGQAGALLMLRAQAKLDRPLRPFHPPERISEDYELDTAVEELEPILFVLRRLFTRLEARLEARALSAGTISLTFTVEPALDCAPVIDVDAPRGATSLRTAEVELSLARSTRKSSTMLAIAREKLSGALPGAVRGIIAEARSNTPDHGAQLDLFSSYPRKIEEVGELVGRLQVALGKDAIFSPELKDTHRPEAAWTKKAFEIERALEQPITRAPRPKTRELAAEGPGEIFDRARSTYMLPEVNDELLVAEMPANHEGSVEAVLAELEEKKKKWPKAIERKIEDDPLPALPPRPLELFDPPEHATLHTRTDHTGTHASSYSAASSDRRRSRISMTGEAILCWRGERLRLRTLSGCERLEAEWWTPSPLAREYVVAEAEDGRKLWLFFDPNGELFVHGIFD